MILYVIITFMAILIGMAISLSAFGTGGKRKKIFQSIYFSIEDVDGIGVLYTKTPRFLESVQNSWRILKGCHIKLGEGLNQTRWSSNRWLEEQSLNQQI